MWFEVLCCGDAALRNWGSQLVSVKLLVLEGHEHAVSLVKNTCFSHTLKK